METGAVPIHRKGDPRQVKDVLVAQGIEPNPGPRSVMRRARAVDGKVYTVVLAMLLAGLFIEGAEARWLATRQREAMCWEGSHGPSPPRAANGAVLHGCVIALLHVLWIFFWKAMRRNRRRRAREGYLFGALWGPPWPSGARVHPMPRIGRRTSKRTMTRRRRAVRSATERRRRRFITRTTCIAASATLATHLRAWDHPETVAFAIGGAFACLLFNLVAVVVKLGLPRCRQGLHARSSGLRRRADDSDLATSTDACPTGCTGDMPELLMQESPRGPQLHKDRRHLHQERRRHRTCAPKRRPAVFLLFTFVAASALVAVASTPGRAAHTLHDPRARGPAPSHAEAEVHRQCYNLLWSPRRRRTHDRPGHDLGDDQPRAEDEDDFGEPSCADERRRFTIITGNIHAAAPRMEKIALWGCDLAFLQETKLAPHAIESARQVVSPHGWTLVHGKPCQPQRQREGVAVEAAREANRGGVAALIKLPRKPLKQTDDTLQSELYATARWQEITVPMSAGTDALTCANYYGISGASSDSKAWNDNEALLSRAVERLIAAGDAPYILLGDFNIDPAESTALATAVEAGLMVDLAFSITPATQDEDDPDVWTRRPQATYRKSGPFVGMDGKGTSRIDAIFANPAAAALVTDLCYEWDLVEHDHVPLKVVLDTNAFTDYRVVHNTRGAIDVADFPELAADHEDLIYRTVWTLFARDLEAALGNSDLDRAHILWNELAETYIMTAKGTSPNDALRKIRAAPSRGGQPTFTKCRRAAPTDHIGSPTTYRQRQLTNCRNQVNDLIARLNARARNGDPDPWTQRGQGDRQLGKLKEAWVRIARKLPHLAPHGHALARRLADGDADSTARPAAAPGTLSALPTVGDLKDIVVMLMHDHDKIAKAQADHRRRESAQLRKWDWEKNFGKKAFARTRGTYAPPTHAVKDPHDGNRFTFSTTRIHDLFMDVWAGIYRKHADDPPDARRFMEQYGRYTKYTPAYDGPITAHEMVDQLGRTKPSAAGFDGWTKDSLSKLPLQVWQVRADIDELALKLGRLPQAYSHVITPMIPKGAAETPQDHRGITIFSQLHRVHFGAWWNRLKTWQEGWAHPQQHGGRIGGEFLADAWDLQSKIEASNAEQTPLVGALLDYAKFFDLFHPQLVYYLMIAYGLPVQLATQIKGLYEELVRYLRIGNSYGAVIRQANGVGQGCSLSLLIANAYVATLFRFLEEAHPGVDMAAFLDDRNATAETARELVAAIESITRFDDLAGHFTNVAKSAVFATCPTQGANLKRTTVGGQTLKVKREATMVGHSITTRRRHGTAHMDMRAANAKERAARIARAPYPKQWKQKLIQTAAAPALVCGCLWELPSIRNLSALRTAFVDAIWGNKRRQRCHEILLGVINDPTLVDPLSILVFNRLRDARRLLRKSPSRAAHAEHVHLITYDEDAEREQVHAMDQGPIRGLRQAAALLGGKLEVDDHGLFIQLAAGRHPIHLTRGSDGVWKRRTRQAIRDAITRVLAGRLVDPQLPSDQRNTKGAVRKDLYGISDNIDAYATNALAEGRKPPVPDQMQQRWIELGADDDPARFRQPVWRQRLFAIVTGSIRCADRLFKAKIVPDPTCMYCPPEIETADHLLWQCPRWHHIRMPYINAMREYITHVARQSAARAQELRDMMRLPCFRNCGVIPGDHYLDSKHDAPPEQVPEFAAPRPPFEELTPRQQSDLQWEDGKVLAFVDGSTIYPEDLRRARSAWAVYFAPSHPWNVAAPVTTDDQTTYRAELTAVAHALAAARVPTLVVSDCESVVMAVTARLAGAATPTANNQDLWGVIDSAIVNRPRDYFGIEWVKSHLDNSRAEEIERRGGFQARKIWGNNHADLLAKDAIGKHTFLRQRYAAADDRVVLAMLVQRMLVAVWNAAIEENPAFARHATDGLWHLQQDDDAEDQPSTSSSSAHPRPHLHAAQHDCGDHQGEEHGDDDPREQVNGVHDPHGGSLPLDGAGLRQPLEQHRQYVDDRCSGSGNGGDWRKRGSNIEVARRLMQTFPNYLWDHADGRFDVQVFAPDPMVTLVMRPQVYVRLPGRGMVNTSVSFLPHFAHPVRWWINSLRWTATPEEEGLPATVANTVTYLECAIDFELSTGVRLTANDGSRLAWAEQAALLYRIVRAIGRTSTFVLNGRPITTLAEALAPRTKVPSITALGAPLASGFARRPRWLAAKTPEVVAVNVFKAMTAARDGRVDPATAVTTFAKHWKLDFAGYPHEGQWTPEPLDRLRERLRKQIDELRSEGEPGETREVASPPILADTPSGASPPCPPHAPEAVADADGTSTSSTGCPPEPPLPRITREMKAGTATLQEVTLLHRDRKPYTDGWGTGDDSARQAQSFGDSGVHDDGTTGNATGAGSSTDGISPMVTIAELESVRELVLLAADVKKKRHEMMTHSPSPASCPAEVRRGSGRPCGLDVASSDATRPAGSSLINGTKPLGDLPEDRALPPLPTLDADGRIGPRPETSTSPSTSSSAENGDAATNLVPRQPNSAPESPGCHFGHPCKPLQFRINKRPWRGAPPGSHLCARCYLAYSKGYA